MKTFLILSCWLSVSGMARAQDAGQVGVTLGYPAEVGIVWHVTDRVAVRPNISFSHASTDHVSDFSSLGDPVDSEGSSSTSLTTGVSGLIYVRTWDKVRAYLSPRYDYGRIWSNAGSTFLTENKHSAYAVTGSFGAQYQLHQRFAVFGEAGFGYSHSSTTYTSSLVLPVIPVGVNVAPVSRSDEIATHSWSTRSGAGVIFYFK
jgi:hypothetical protein